MRPGRRCGLRRIAVTGRQSHRASRASARGGDPAAKVSPPAWTARAGVLSRPGHRRSRWRGHRRALCFLDRPFPLSLWRWPFLYSGYFLAQLHARPSYLLAQLQDDRACAQWNITRMLRGVGVVLCLCTNVG